jgi:hypothetical protein
MTYGITTRPETALGLTTYWLVVDGDNVGTIAPLVKQLAPVPVADYWVWRINFPMMNLPDWCQGRAPSLEEAWSRLNRRSRGSGIASRKLNTTRRFGKMTARSGAATRRQTIEGHFRCWHET